MRKSESILFHEDEFYGYGEIGYLIPETKRGNTLQISMEKKYTEVRVLRLPWADGYGDEDNIPIEVKFAHGWWLECNTCGGHITESEDFFMNDKGILLQGVLLYLKNYWRRLKNRQTCRGILPEIV